MGIIIIGVMVASKRKMNVGYIPYPPSYNNERKRESTSKCGTKQSANLIKKNLQPKA